MCCAPPSSKLPTTPEVAQRALQIPGPAALLQDARKRALGIHIAHVSEPLVVQDLLLPRGAPTRLTPLTQPQPVALAAVAQSLSAVSVCVCPLVYDLPGEACSTQQT